MEAIAYEHRSHDAMGVVQHTIKRLTDVILSAVALVILSPVFLVIYIALKKDGTRRVLFRQERIGRYAKPFTIYKFRTMKEGSEGDTPKLCADVDQQSSTKIQIFLRQHHLDELPQLWNVLTGDMSIVGPRPERQYFIDMIMEHDHDYELIFEMRPGLTSEATLYNGYTDTMEKMLRRLHMDIHYLENRSLALDMRIMWDTFISIISGRKF